MDDIGGAKQDMNPFDYFLEGLKKYAEFKGRARRKAYWYFVLFSLIISFVLSYIDTLLGTYSIESGIGLLSGLFSLSIIVPSIAITVRRLHDTGRTGWWVLLGFIPILNLVLIFFMVLDSQPEENSYGPNPKPAAP